MSDRLVASAAAPLAERDAALSQLRSLRELLVDGAPPPAAEGARWKDDWQRLTDTLCATLLAFRRSFKTEAEGARLVELRRTFRLESAASTGRRRPGAGRHCGGARLLDAGAAFGAG